jgi:hypothetical protein
VQDRQANFNIDTGRLELPTSGNRSFVPTDNNNFAPRFGFAYDMFWNAEDGVARRLRHLLLR